MLLRKAEKALDWQGREVCCTGCVHRELSREDRCRQKHICVHDRSPSRMPEDIGIFCRRRTHLKVRMREKIVGQTWIVFEELLDALGERS